MHAKQFSAALLDILVCPVCHEGLELGPAGAVAPDWLRCRGCGLHYPIEDGIPVMLESRATKTPSGPGVVDI